MQHKLITSIAILAVVSLLIVSVITISRSFQKQKRDLLQAKVTAFQEKQNIINTVYHHVARLVFDAQIRDSEMNGIMWRAVHATSDEEKAQIRNELFEKNVDLYRILTEYDFRQLHYHLPNSESFLRMHKPDRFGDSLIGIRQTVMDANKYKQEVQGFEEGRIFNGYRYVFPLFHQGEHVGSVEVSVSSKVIISNLKKLFGNSYHFLLRKDVVDAKVFEEERLQFYSECTIHDQYYIDKSTIDEDFVSQISDEQMLRQIQETCREDIESMIPFSKLLHVHGEIIYFTGVPVKNYTGDEVGYLFEIDRDNSQYALIIASLRSRLAAATIVLILILLSLMFYQKYLVHQERLSNLKYVSALSITASHELNQPLQSLQMNIEMIESQPDLQDRVRDRLPKLFESISRIRRILNKMHDIKQLILEQYTDAEMMLDLDKSTEEELDDQ